MTVSIFARRAARTFSLIPPTGKHFAAQSDFAGHRDLAMHGFAGQQRQHGRGHGHAGGRSVFRNGAFGHMNVDVVLGEEVVVDTEFLRMRPRIAQRRLRRFFHDVAELSGERQTAAAAHGGGFDEENVAADRRPCQVRLRRPT